LSCICLSKVLGLIAKATEPTANRARRSGVVMILQNVYYY